MLRRLLFVAIFFLLSNDLFSFTINGQVTDKTGEPLPYANVYIKGTTRGTTTNLDGKYFLPVNPGEYTIVFKFLGYKVDEKNITVNDKDIELNVVLSPENYNLKEVVIKASDEDPAYAIIRNAIKKRKLYLEQVNAFSCNVYIKGMQRLSKYPKKIFGVTVDFGGMLDSTTGVVYLSESVSQYNFEKPDHIKEVMISSKVSGSNKAFSYNRASDMYFNFYENNVGRGGLSDRGFISPIAGNALFYYHYKYLGAFTENGLTVDKIEVIPKRRFDPVFKGNIYIVEDSWRIHSTELLLTKEAQIDFVDTISIKQIHVPVEGHPDIWMPVSNRFDFIFSAFGFEGGGTYVGVNSDYNVNPKFEKGYFGGEVMKVNEDANKRDSSYWNNIRPIPLSEMEKKDYVKKDSIAMLRESKPYLDSLDRISNKFSFGKIILSGYNYRERYKKQSFTFSPLLQNVQFNTVEGLNLSLQMDYSKTFEKRRRISFEPYIRYGFSNKHFNSDLGISYYYNRVKFASVKIRGGSAVSQFNNENPISELINTSYTLFTERNYMKIYEKRFAEIKHSIELINGVYLTTGIEWARRIPMKNTNYYSFKNFENRWFTSNDPTNKSENKLGFEQNESLTFSAETKIKIKQKYISRPDNKIIEGSPYPTIFVNYRKGIKNILESDVDYDFIKTGLEDEIWLGLLGTSSFKIAYGNFLTKKKLYYMDVQHFNGNQTIFSSFRLNDFQVLDYYSNSTVSESYEAHVEHNFSGFIFNKIPLLRKLKLDEIVSFHYLHINGLDDHYEIGYGLEKLSAFRVDLVTGFTGNSKPSFGIRIGIKAPGQ